MSPSCAWLPCADTTVRKLPPGWTVPPIVGGFVFPEPWNTRASRITDDAQGAELEPIGMAYWRNINAHRDRDELLVVLSLGGDLALFSVNKTTGTPRLVKGLGVPSTGEGVYFSAHDPAILYLSVGNGLYRLHVETGARSTVFEVDATTYLWQCHSSDDERTHSATVRASNETMLGWVVHREGVYGPTFIPRIGACDECAIDGSGDWLVAKETFPDPIGESNRIVRDGDVRTARTISNRDGAVGHSDMGAGYTIGENDMAPVANALDRIDLETLAARRVYHGIVWANGVGYVSLTNVHDRSFGLVSNATPFDHPRDNEILQITIDGSLLFRPLAPSLCHLAELDGDAYYKNRPKANLCPSGQYFVWTANHGTDHLDAFVGEVPQ